MAKKFRLKREIDTEKLYVGQEFKNYTELCRYLNLKTGLNGNQRMSQKKELRQYFDFAKMSGSNRIVITEIYGVPKEKDDLRHKGNNWKDSGYEDNYNLNEVQSKMKGVYAIHQGKDIYIGYTSENFRRAFITILSGKQPYLLEMIQNGAIFDVIWALDTRNIGYIQRKKRITIYEFLFRGYNVVNHRNECTIDNYK